MVEVGHYQDLGKITDKLSGAHGSNCRRNLVYSATLTVSRRICERRGKKYRASTCQDVMGVWVKWCAWLNYEEGVLNREAFIQAMRQAWSSCIVGVVYHELCVVKL